MAWRLFTSHDSWSKNANFSSQLRAAAANRFQIRRWSHVSFFFDLEAHSRTARIDWKPSHNFFFLAKGPLFCIQMTRLRNSHYAKRALSQEDPSFGSTAWFFTAITQELAAAAAAAKSGFRVETWLLLLGAMKKKKKSLARQFLKILCVCVRRRRRRRPLEETFWSVVGKRWKNNAEP